MSTFAEILEAIAHAPVRKRAITNHEVLNEAFAYAKPSSFSRGMLRWFGLAPVAMMIESEV